MRLAVFAETLQLYQPYRLDVYDSIGRLVVNGAAVYGLRRLVYQLYIQDIRIYLLYSVALSVAGQPVDEHRYVRLNKGSYQVKLVMLFEVIRCPRSGGSDLLVVFREQFLYESVREISSGVLAA